MDGFVTVYRSSDPIAAEIARDLLDSSGIPARLLGGGGELWGGGLGDTRVEVPLASLADALALLASQEPAPETMVDEENEAEEAPAPRRLRALIAAGVAPLFPGGGHFYARRPLVGAVIVAGWLALFFVFLRLGLGALWLVGLLTFDVVGALFAVRAENRDRPRPGTLRQVLTGVTVLALVGGATSFLTPVLRQVRRGRANGQDAWRDTRPARPDELPFPAHLDLSK